MENNYSLFDFSSDYERNFEIAKQCFGSNDVSYSSNMGKAITPNIQISYDNMDVKLDIDFSHNQIIRGNLEFYISILSKADGKRISGISFQKNVFWFEGVEVEHSYGKSLSAYSERQRALYFDTLPTKEFKNWYIKYMHLFELGAKK